MNIKRVGVGVIIPRELHKEISKISQETGDTIRSVVAGILTRAKEKSLFGPSIVAKIKEPKSVSSGSIPEDNGGSGDEIDKNLEEIKKHEKEEEKENIGKGKDKPIPENKEKKMLEAEDIQTVKEIVGKVKEGISVDIDSKLTNHQLAYEQGIKNLIGKIDMIKTGAGTEVVDKAPSLTKQDVQGLLDKRDTQKAETEAARLRKAEQDQTAKDAGEARKQNDARLLNLECSLNPEKPECQALMKVLGREVAKIVNPEDKEKDDDGKGGESSEEPKTAEQVIADVINGLKLPVMKKEIREKMKTEEIEGRTTNVAKLVEQFNVTPVDMLNVLRIHPDDKKGIALYVAGDPDLAKEVLKRADVKAKIEGCNLGDEKQCLLADEILNESNLALVKKAKKGNRYNFINPKLDTGTGF